MTQNVTLNKLPDRDPYGVDGGILAVRLSWAGSCSGGSCSVCVLARSFSSSPVLVGSCPGLVAVLRVFTLYPSSLCLPPNSDRNVPPTAGDALETTCHQPPGFTGDRRAATTSASDGRGACASHSEESVAFSPLCSVASCSSRISSAPSRSWSASSRPAPTHAPSSPRAMR